MNRTSKVLRRTLGLVVLWCMLPLGMHAQNITVKGTVSAADGPIIGATVKVKGAQGGAVTDYDGNYTISAQSNATLIFSYVGYETKEVKVGGKSVINVTLSEDETLLNEVVVVGYGTMRKSDLTGAVTQVDNKAFEKSVSTSIDQVLQGRAAGVQIQANTGTPGGSSTIRIRGTNSLNASSQPIFVIDGVIIDPANGDDDGNSNPLASINPSDILTMDILKDASATAIYGSRASNGVIMITTKRGKAGEATITYDGYIGWQTMPKKLDVMNLQQYAQHYNDIAAVGGIKSAVNSFVKPELLGEGTDWQDELFSAAFMTNHSLSLTGGTEKTTYAISAGYMNQDGIAIGTGFRRQTVRGNIDTELKKWLKGGISFSLSDTRQEMEKNWDVINTALRSQPSVAVRNPEGGYDGPDDQWMPDNAVALAELKTKYAKRVNFRINTYLEATILKGLTLKTELSADYNLNKTKYYQPEATFGVKDIPNEATWYKNDTKYWSWRNILTYNGTIGKKHNINAMIGQEMSDSYWENMNSSNLGYLSNSVTDLSAGETTGANVNIAGYQDRTRLYSYFGRVLYNFDDRYLLTATLRADGSSKFADGHRWGWFPSAAFAWRASQENFLKNNKVINNLKLRLGWGATGNQNIANWQWSSMLANYTTTWGVGVLNANNANENLKWETTYSTNIGFDLSLFHSRIDIVFDWYYKKTNDLLMIVDIPAFAGSGGGSKYGVASSPWANVGSLRNTGIEITLNTVNIENKNFQWRSNFVFSLNRNKVLSLDTETGTLPKTLQIGDETATVTNTVVGQPIGQFWGYKVIGRFDKPEDFYYKDANGNIQPVALPESATIGDKPSSSEAFLGDYIFEDISGPDGVPDGVIDNYDQTFIGNPEPKFTWGFGNTFSYKGFDLSIQFSGSYGNKVLNYQRRFLDITGTTANQLTTVLNYARLAKIDPNGPDDYRNYYVTNPGTIMPRISPEGWKNKNNRVSDAYVEDGSFIRLQNISLSYTLPRKWIQKIYLNNVKVYCNIQNLFTITKYDGMDPEVGSLRGDALYNGVDYSRYPSPRIYTFGVNVQF